MSPIVDLLQKLQTLTIPELSVWVLQLLTLNGKEPECLSPADLAHLRLLRLIQTRTPDLTLQHQVTQLSIKEATSHLFGLYHPSRHSIELGTELLAFAQAIHDSRGILHFNNLLCYGAFDYTSDSQRRLLREAHWIVGAAMNDWERIRTWVVRDAALRNNSRAGDVRWLEVAISAIGVWSAYGPVSTLSSILDQIPLVLLSGHSEMYKTELIVSFRRLMDRLKHTPLKRAFNRKLRKAASEKVGDFSLEQKWRYFLDEAEFPLDPSISLDRTAKISCKDRYHLLASFSGSSTIPELRGLMPDCNGERRPL